MTELLTYSRMMEGAPEQYETSRIYQEIQRTVAAELYKIATDNEDLRQQLRVRTATWGLKYWENAVRLTSTDESYAVRRSRVLGRLRSIGNFSIAMVKSIAAAYTANDLDVVIDFETGLIEIEFIGDLPADVAGFQAQINDVIHAHLGAVYKLVIRGEAVQINTKQRGYVVPLPIANTFVTTNNEHGKAIGVAVGLNSQQRAYETPYPICNDFYTGG